MDDKWTSDVDEKNLQPEKMKIVFAEAKDKLESTVENHASIQQKLMLVLGFTVTITTGVLGYSAGKGLALSCEHEPFLLSFLLFAALAGVSIYKLCTAIQPASLENVGYSPRKLFTDAVMGQEEGKILRILVKKYAYKIEKNEEKNTRNAAILRNAMWMFLAGIGQFLLLSLLLNA